MSKEDLDFRTREGEPNIRIGGRVVQRGEEIVENNKEAEKRPKEEVNHGLKLRVGGEDWKG